MGIKMARARNIKPAFFQNEELAELSPLERLSFIAMWTIADFKGCIEYRPKRLKIQILPYDDCDINLIVINLEKSRFITSYSVLGQLYIKIVNFEKHQNPHPNEKKSGSDIHDIDKNDNSNNDLKNIMINHEQDGTNRADTLIPLTDSLLPIPTKKTKSENNNFNIKELNTINKNLLDEWLVIRKRKKCGPVTERVFNALVRECKIINWTLDQAISKCCERSWATFEAGYLSQKELREIESKTGEPF